MTKRPCSIDGCDKLAHARGWCPMHYQRWRMTGTTDTPVRSLPAEQRFWSRVDVGGPDDCWLYRSRTDPRKHAQLSIGNGCAIGAHVMSYILHNGPVPDGMQVNHHCDNPPCVNPAHLYAGTVRENAWDAVNRDRAPMGVRHGMSKLTPEIVVEIRSSPLSHSELGRRYGVSYTTVQDVRRGRTWKHVGS